jgi:hypothetical protein
MDNAARPLQRLVALGIGVGTTAGPFSFVFPANVCGSDVYI